MNKFKSSLLRFYNWLKKFPVMCTLAVLVPVIIYATIYTFSPEFVYSNLYYTGVVFDVDPQEFSITKINPLFKIMDISSFSNYQGGTCYEDYYVLCSNNFECLLIYNMNNHKVEHTIYTNMTNTDYHCNTIFFGPDFYSSIDKFPILYVSMENEGVEATIAYRIYQDGGSYSISQVQKINLVCDDGTKIYLPNSYFDYSNNILYYSGYTQNSYMKSDDNMLKYYTFFLPDFRIAECDLNTKNAITSFELPSETATQGGFISDRYLFQTFSFNSETDPLRKPKMRIVDLVEEVIVYDEQDLGKYGVYDEFENIAACHNGHLYGFGVKSLQVFDFEFTGDTSNG